VVAARRATKKMTPQLTAMIPISRRTIARARVCWVSAGSDSKSVSPSSRSAAPARAPSARKEIFGCLVIRHHQQAAQQGLKEDGDLGRAQQVPEGDGGKISVPGDASDQPAAEVEEDHPASHRDVDADHGLYPPKGVGIPLDDAEKHYVASCHNLVV
jgi:hypothetical protein